MRLIVLAAGTGSRLAPLTDDRPKCLVELDGRPLLDWTLSAARRAGIEDIVLVGGYRIAALSRFGLPVVENPDFAATNMVDTLFRARAHFGSEFVMAYGDIMYGPDVLQALLSCPGEIAVVVDRAWRAYWERRSENPLADAETLRLGPDGCILELGQRPDSLDDIEAQYIGLAAFRGAGVAAIEDAWRRAEAGRHEGGRFVPVGRPFRRWYMTDLLQFLIDTGGLPVRAVPIAGGWAEIDTGADLSLARQMLAEGLLAPPGEVPRRSAGASRDGQGTVR